MTPLERARKRAVVENDFVACRISKDEANAALAQLETQQPQDKGSINIRAQEDLARRLVDATGKALAAVLKAAEIDRSITHTHHTDAAYLTALDSLNRKQVADLEYFRQCHSLANEQALASFKIKVHLKDGRTMWVNSYVGGYASSIMIAHSIEEAHEFPAYMRAAVSELNSFISSLPDSETYKQIERFEVA
jgi:hypothetical protein